MSLVIHPNTKDAGFMISSNTLLQIAEERLPRVLAWLRELVAVNSLTTNVAGVNQVGLLTAEGFAELGFQPEWVEPENVCHGKHLFLHRGPQDKQPVVLVTHLDTVFSPEEEAQNSFYWQEEGSLIYGPGTVDIKGGTAMIRLMLEIMQATMPELLERHSWIIAANSAEEVISSDFSHRLHERCPMGAQAVLVFEGGPRDTHGWHLITARKGRKEFRLECKGRSAHAGSAYAEGINAVVELASKLQGLQSLTDLRRDLTVNVATMNGGSVLNRVPHLAVAELEMRAYDPKALEDAAAAVRQLQGMTTGGAQISVRCLGSTPPWPGGEQTLALFQHWQRAATQLGMTIQARSRGGLSDANYLHDLGPTLDGLGPSGGNAHCSERSLDGSKMPEYVERDSFAPKAVMNLLALASLLK